MTKAETIATYLVQNWHACPIDESVEIPDCPGWQCRQCVKCICKHAENLIIYRGEDFPHNDK